MVDFAALKRNRNNTFEKLNSELSKLGNNEKSSADDRFWKPEVDKAGNGYAIIRFLPAPGEEDVPFVRIWDHGFQGPGGWYIENSLTTIGQKDPVAELNSALWNVSSDDNSPTRKQARTQKRRLHYISNIYVVNDPAKPDNNGKVFLYKYGKKIFDKINDLMNPSFQDEKPINPFDLWAGANFKLKIRQVEGYRNYDKSEFDSSAPLHEDDDQLETIWKKEYSLKTFLDQSNFKTYDELKAKLNKVLNSKADLKPKNEDAEESYTPAPKPKAAAASTPPWQADDDEDDDNISFFKKLSEED